MLFVSKLPCQPTKSIFLTELQFTVLPSKIQVKWSRNLSVRVYMECS